MKPTTLQTAREYALTCTSADGGTCFGTQAGEDQQGLLPGTQLPPARSDRGPVAADDPGHEGEGLTGTKAARHGRKARESLVAMKVVLADCLIYQGLLPFQRRHAAPSPDRDEPITIRMKNGSRFHVDSAQTISYESPFRIVDYLEATMSDAMERLT